MWREEVGWGGEVKRGSDEIGREVRGFRGRGKEGESHRMITEQ